MLAEPDAPPQDVRRTGATSPASRSSRRGRYLLVPPPSWTRTSRIGVPRTGPRRRERTQILGDLLLLRALPETRSMVRRSWGGINSATSAFDASTRAPGARAG